MQRPIHTILPVLRREILPFLVSQKYITADFARILSAFYPHKTFRVFFFFKQLLLTHFFPKSMVVPYSEPFKCRIATAPRKNAIFLLFFEPDKHIKNEGQCENGTHKFDFPRFGIHGWEFFVKGQLKYMRNNSV